nr:beta-galactosidase 9 [Ipomoea batatas]
MLKFICFTFTNICQIENEYGNIESEYGSGGKAYMEWAAQMAFGLGAGVPWIMCQQTDAPEYIIDTCNGYYCDDFSPNSDKKPKIWTENWDGGFASWGGRIPHRPAEDIAFAVARFFQRSGSLSNYYMVLLISRPFYIIRNKGLLRQPKWGHLKDLHAAIKLCEPALVAVDSPQYFSLGPLQEAHVYSGNTLNNGQNLSLHKSTCSAFLANIDEHHTATVTFYGQVYTLPPWSVSILPDCRNVAFNTAKVGVQTSIKTIGQDVAFSQAMIQRKVMAQSWMTVMEPIGVWGKTFTYQGILEHLNVTKDLSDYLWYTTRQFASNEDILFWEKGNTTPALTIDSMRDFMCTFINGQLAVLVFRFSPWQVVAVLLQSLSLQCSDHATAGHIFASRATSLNDSTIISFAHSLSKVTSQEINQGIQNGILQQVLQLAPQLLADYFTKFLRLPKERGCTKGDWVKVVQPVKFVQGYNDIVLLSQTVGLKNSDAFFEKDGAGFKGQVKLTGWRNGDIDITNSTWTYQVGLKGEFLEAYAAKDNKYFRWKEFPHNSTPHIFSWYKTYFDAPVGTDPVAIDLSGMGKGQVWVNGQHIGRYWSLKAPEDGCNTCDYRGAFDADKCVTNCGQLTQSWYHIPRSWLQPSNNLLVIFEETNRAPLRISIEPRFTSTICSKVPQDHYPPLNAWSDGQLSSNSVAPELHLQCDDGHTISSIEFASYGTPQGHCQQFSQGNCHAASSSSLISQACLGKNSCSIQVSDAIFGDPCGNVIKTLAVQAKCSPPVETGFSDIGMSE